MSPTSPPCSAAAFERYLRVSNCPGMGPPVSQTPANSDWCPLVELDLSDTDADDGTLASLLRRPLQKNQPQPVWDQRERRRSFVPAIEGRALNLNLIDTKVTSHGRRQAESALGLPSRPLTISDGNAEEPGRRSQDRPTARELGQHREAKSTATALGHGTCSIPIVESC